MKKLLAVLMIFAVLMTSVCMLQGCGENDDPTEPPSQSESSDETDPTKETYADVDLKELEKDYPKDIKYDTEHEVGYQLDMPQKGDEIAVIHTSMGDITIRLFRENAPKTVENFVELAKKGEYNDVPFHRVINDFMIQTGDTTNGDGTGGATYNGEILPDEFCDKLFNIRGSVSMANSGRDTNSSQFFINQTKPEATSSWDELEDSWEYIYEGICAYFNTDSFISFAAYYGSSCYNPNLVSDEIKELYNKNGGNPHLDGAFNAVDRGHTVFGQVIDGMDVVDSIAAVEVDENSKPKTDITIKSVEITQY